MPKAEGRHAVQATWDKAFIKNAYPAELENATVVCDDNMQRIKALSTRSDSAPPLTWRQGSEAMIREPIRFLKEFPKIKTYVITNDVYANVPLAKAPEQVTRSTNTLIVDDILISDSTFRCGPLDAEIPVTWKQAVNHRTKYTPMVLAWMTHSWVSTEIYKKIPHGSSIIVSGHYITDNDGAATIGLEGEIAVHIPSGAEDIFHTPLEFRSDGSVVLRRDLSHRLGEGDYAMPYLANQLLPHGGTCVMLSVDSDFISILLMATFKRERDIRFLWRLWPGLANIANGNWRTVRGLDDQTWCDISILYDSIASDPGLQGFTSPVFAVIAALTAAGGDYTDPVPRVPHHHWLRGIRNNSKYIGDIFSEYMVFDKAAYARLQEVACRQALAGLKKDFMGIEGSTVGNGAPKCNKIPDSEDTDHRANHLWLALLMVLKTGDASVDVVGLSGFSYARIAIDLPVSRTNITRLHSGTVRDYFDDTPAIVVTPTVEAIEVDSPGYMTPSELDVDAVSVESPPKRKRFIPAAYRD